MYLAPVKRGAPEALLVAKPQRNSCSACACVDCGVTHLRHCLSQTSKVECMRTWIVPLVLRQLLFSTCRRVLRYRRGFRISRGATRKAAASCDERRRCPMKGGSRRKRVTTPG